MAGIAHGPVTVQGFTVVCLKFNEENKGHFIYVKTNPDQDSSVSRPQKRTLFVLNVPPYCDRESLTRVFSQCGKVVDVELQDTPTVGPSAPRGTKYFPVGRAVPGFKVAYIVFKKAFGVINACSLPHNKPLLLSTDEHPVSTGISKWCAQYAANRVDVKELQQEVEEYMKQYDAKQEEKLQRQKEQDGVPDEEGWITVTRVGKNKGAPRTEARKKHLSRKELKRKKDKELLNFYAFQFKDSKQDQITALRKKFEEDKQKIAVMKAQRKFRPY